jgi:serine/threonine protein kinase
MSRAIRRTAALWLVLVAASAQAGALAHVSSHGVDRTLELDRVLGEGALGRTYQAHDVSHPDQQFAVKVVRLEELHNPAANTLEKESGVLDELAKHSDKFPKSYGTGAVLDHTAAPAFAMDLLKGRSLGGAGPGRGWDSPLHLAPGKAVRVARTLLDQLADMHAAGLVHGDVHTGNTRINEKLESWTAKLVDFGTTHAYSPQGAVEDVANTGRVLLETLTGRSFTDQIALREASAYHASVGGRDVNLRDVITTATSGGYKSAAAFRAALAPFAAMAP